MSKIATLRGSAQQANDRAVLDLATTLDRVSRASDELAERIRTLDTMKAATAEDLATTLAPIAEAMARLTEETRRTLARVVRASDETSRKALESVTETSEAAGKTVTEVKTAMLRLSSEIEKLRETVLELRQQPIPSPWPPALFVAAVVVVSVGALAWRAGLLP